MKRKPGALYFTDVAIAKNDEVVLTGNYYDLEDSSEERIALLSLVDGTWGGADLSGTAHAVRVEKSGSRKTYYILERDRGIYIVRPPGKIDFVQVAPDRRGFLMDLRKIGQSWYAVGGHHQVHISKSAKNWSSFDKEIAIDDDDGIGAVLLSVDGTSDDDIYAVGFDGVIFHFDGTSWYEYESPTNLGLQRVLCVGPDEVYLCGNARGLYKGNRTHWTELTDLDESETFWDMAYFQESVYVCSKKSLYKIEGDDLIEIDVPVKGPLGFYRMSCNSDQLWTCGNECLLRFDGSKWKQYVFPDNR
jgi:hypothetical protein